MANESILASGRADSRKLAEEEALAAFADLKANGKQPQHPDYEETEHGAWKWEIRG